MLNATASGPLFASPEAACCACGRATFHAMSSSHVTSLLFLAAHAVDPSLASTLSHLTRDLSRAPPSAHLPSRPWLLLFTGQHPIASPPVDSPWRSLDADVCPWTLAQVFSLFPKLKHSFRKSAAVQETDEDYLKHYFLFHTSLALWWRLFGHSHPKLQHFWRIEPDVQLVGLGGWATLLHLSSSVGLDVLLPKPTTQAHLPSSTPTLTPTVTTLQQFPWTSAFGHS